MVETMTESHIECPRCGKRFARADMAKHLSGTHQRRTTDVSGDCRTCNGSETFRPAHDASPRCESGWRTHCSCDTCF